MKKCERNSKNEPVRVIMGNPVYDPKTDSEMRCPTCPTCDEPAYSATACLFCGQPFTAEREGAFK